MTTNTVSRPGHRAPVSVLGLGAMGAALARAVLAAGHPTTVWNRTSSRADDLVAAGATLAPTAGAAVLATPLTILCLLDRAAVEEVLAAIGTDLGAATIVNLTSSTPEDAEALAARVEAAGARYLEGKIMVPTSMVGTPEALLLYSGDRSVFAEHRDTLVALGGRADHLGAAPGLAALHDLGMLDIFFSGMTAFLHAVALVGADGVSAKAFLSYADDVLTVLRATLPGLADDADRGDYPGHEDNLEMNAAALNHIVEASAARGLDVSVPAVPRELARAAIAVGHGRDSFSRVIDVVRRFGNG